MSKIQDAEQPCKELTPEERSVFLFLSAVFSNAQHEGGQRESSRAVGDISIWTSSPPSMPNKRHRRTGRMDRCFSCADGNSTSVRNPEKLNRNPNMSVCGEMILWSFVFLLAGAVAQTVVYPFTSTCAVRGSTVTLPCTFTPRKSFSDGQREVPLKIVRVRWCKNHAICQGSTPSVYDSNSANIDPRYQYLGDKKTNCTLQIRDVQQRDKGSFRFRMEADHPEGHFTNQTGVNVTVVDSSKMRIISSSDDKKLSRGENVTLLCASVCTFHQLEVTWFKDGHALSDTGPSLHLSPLTAEDSGNYTCALKKNMKTLSEPYSLQVEAGADGVLRLVLGVVFGLLLAVILLVLFTFIIKRKLAAAEDQRAVGGDPEQKHPDSIYSNMVTSAQTEAAQQQEPGRAAEDVSYASVQFKQKKQGARRLQAASDDVVYSSVSSRG
ncbi:myeloid cell surface antigen CD33-like isoform X1 [Astatotilapia calliptera]|nr:myeloid cell surface antigen CD33-like isoform X1 [Astatotilapia calliptera]